MLIWLPARAVDPRRPAGALGWTDEDARWVGAGNRHRKVFRHVGPRAPADLPRPESTRRSTASHDQQVAQGRRARSRRSALRGLWKATRLSDFAAACERLLARGARQLVRVGSEVEAARHCVSN